MSCSRKKLLINTDAGIDDAQAILMALKDPDVEVVAITTTHGNTDEHHVCRNVLRVLKLAGRLDVRINLRLSCTLNTSFVVINSKYW